MKGESLNDDLKIGDLVWLWHTPTQPKWGHVADFDGTVAIKTCVGGDLVYFDREMLHHAIELPDGVYRDNFPYHSNPHRLSPNTAKKLIEPGGPAKYDWERRHKRPSTPAFDFGKVAHKLVLGEGDQFTVLYPEVHGLKKDGTVADSPRSTATWKQAERDARVEGLTPIAVEDFDKAIAMAEAVHANPIARDLLIEGEAEQWLYATENGQGLRLRADWMTQADGRLHVVEYKTAASANPDVFRNKAYDFGYHLHFAFAVAAARLLELDETPAYLYIVQEKEPPYLVSVCELDGDAYKLGREHMRQAIDIYQECMASDRWPGYPERIHPISLPAWAFNTNQRTVSDIFAEADLTGGDA